MLSYLNTSYSGMKIINLERAEEFEHYSVKPELTFCSKLTWRDAFHASLSQITSHLLRFLIQVSHDWVKQARDQNATGPDSHRHTNFSNLQATAVLPQKANKRCCPLPLSKALCPQLQHTGQR